MGQEQLARHLGLTYSQVQKYERGINRISSGRLYLIAHYLIVPIQYFFDEMDDELTAASHAEIKSERALLGYAFQSIADHRVRQAFLALVRSLADMSDGTRTDSEWRESD
jgi:transcriptional regulator with XRE-family HTH domain